jgi:hypothetical protein
MQTMGRVLALAVIGLVAGSNAFAQADLYLGTRHLFPQVVDGQFDDGSGYTTSFEVANSSWGWVHCYVWLVGMYDNRLPDRSFWIYPRGVHRTRTRNQATFDRGYGVLECSTHVTAVATYRRVDVDGALLGMATNRSSPSTYHAVHTVAEGGGRRTGIALVNDSAWTFERYRLTLLDAHGVIRDIRFLDLPPGGSISRFVDELVTVPRGDFLGSLEISGGRFHLTAMSYEGEVFTTVPLKLPY